ncbi:hypothetical protein PC41400_09005 [Paenibacillus chitinolyticus]|uniref:Uncharacterized protein n=1 Tax=Paenibacillus chitinolyticus TaxID=79263 RepID=A0A410WTV8_9BACL|nr:hypothetical protein PC41400_09005 [Paenibacillus chitinolyticus]
MKSGDKTIELEQKHVTVYNMTVDEFHAYFVSELEFGCIILDLVTGVITAHYRTIMIGMVEVLGDKCE